MKMKTFKQLIYLTVAFLLTLTLVMIPNTVNAIPLPYLVEGGSLNFEPIGDFGNLGIVREKIDFDVPSSKGSREGTITATYQIRNDGEQFPLELLFISDGIENSSLTLDGKTVAGETVKNPKIPENLKIPEKIRWVGDDNFTSFVNTPVDSGLKFKPTIPPGEHQLQVKYSVDPYVNGLTSGTPYIDSQIDYILAPARSWAFFNSLEIEIKQPKSWKFKTSLPMKETDNGLKVTFNEIPADYFSFSFTPYFPSYITGSINLIGSIMFWGSFILPVIAGKIAVKRFKTPLIITVLLAFILGGIALTTMLAISWVVNDSLLYLFSIKQYIWVGNSYNGAVWVEGILILLGLLVGGFIGVISFFIFKIFNRKRRKKES